MGKTIEKLAQNKHTIVYKTSQSINPERLKTADVAIDFSIAEAAFKNITTCFEVGIPVVSGTTGWLNHYDDALAKCNALNGTFLYASNFSIGVNLFFQLNQTLAQTMRSFPDYKPVIEEIHHTQKRDKPSGTAITLAEGIITQSDYSSWQLLENDNSKKTEEKTIPVFAKRYEDVKGTHRIKYTSTIDDIEIKHTAHSRDGFAKGALLAAEFIADKKGIFTMKEVVKNLL